MPNNKYTVEHPRPAKNVLVRYPNGDNNKTVLEVLASKFRGTTKVINVICHGPKCIVIGFRSESDIQSALSEIDRYMQSNAH